MDSGMTKKVAVVVSALDEEYQNNIIRGINKSAEENQLSVSYFAAFGGLVNSKRFDLGEYSIYDVIDYSKYNKPVINSDLLMDCKYFTVRRVNINKEMELNANGDSFISFTFLEGKGMVDDLPYKKFDTFFLPYGKKCLIKGKGTVIISSL